MESNNEYLSSTKIIFYFLKMVGIFPFISFQEGTRVKLFRYRFLTTISLTFYSLAFINEVQFVYKTMVPLFRQFEFLYFVKVLPITHTRLYVISIPIISWNKCRQVQDYWDNWMQHQKDLEMITRAQYHSPVKTKICWTSALGTLFTVLITSNTNFESIYYVIIRTGVSSVGYCMVLLELMPILWYVNCKYIESVAKTIIFLVQKSTQARSEENIQNLTRLWIGLCDLTLQFNKSHSALFLGYLSLLVVNLINTIYFSFHLYMVEHNGAVGVTYLLPSLFCIINILILYESAYSASKQITLQTEKVILNCKTTNLNGSLLRSIIYFVDVIEAKKPEFNLSGLVTLNRSNIISLYLIAVNYLIVLRQFATTK